MICNKPLSSSSSSSSSLSLLLLLLLLNYYYYYYYYYAPSFCVESHLYDMMGFIEFRDFKNFTNVASSIFRDDSLKDKKLIIIIIRQMYIFQTQISHVCALRSLVRYDKSDENRIDFY